MQQLDLKQQLDEDENEHHDDDGDDEHEDGDDDDDDDDIEDAIDLEVSEGSLIFFNQHIVHGSTANHSDQERRAYIVTYQPKDRAMLKSGEIKNIQEV